MRINLPTSRRTLNGLLFLVLALSSLAPQSSLAAPAQADDPRATSGEWGALVDWGIFGKHMVLMPNGKVLAWPTGQDAFVWDPVTQTKSAVPATFGDLHCAAQTILADGRVLVAGGQDVQIHNGINVTAIFDPVTNVWTNATPMHYPRWYGTTTTLPDGRVLVTSGDMPNGGRANTPEIYDPATDTWTELTAATRDVGLYPQMYVLPNGQVYKAGTTTGTFLLDVNTGTWTNGPTNAFGSSGYAESSAMYEPGKIIRSGGGDPSIPNAAIVDMNVAPALRQWKQISSMHFPRRRHNLVILADGEVMAIGGTRSADDLGDGITTGAVYEGEIWNPATELWTVTPRMAKDRMYHSSALLLPDGRVLVSGGENTGRLNAQIYSPPYMFKGTRPVITASPSVAAYSAGFAVSVNSSASISKVALIRPAAVTHAFDHDQRFVPLTFSQSGNILSITAPANANYAPPGSYMLVVTDSNGVPSVASWVRVDSAANLTPGTISGTVTDRASGNPVQGATVAAHEISATTDAAGNYTLPNLLPGDQLITVSGASYATIRKTQEVIGGATTTLNFALDPPGTITGTVRDSVSNDKIAGATVLYDGGSVTTNASGTYQIVGIPAGQQALVASANGYTSSAAQNATVPPNGSVTANITLTPKPSYIAGEVHDGFTNQLMAGVVVSTGSVSTTTDSLGRYQLFVPPGTYSVTATHDDYTAAVNLSVLVTFGTYTAADLVLTPTNPALTFASVADDYTNQALPTANNGTASTVRASNSANGHLASYLRFSVTGLTRAVQSAKLRLYVTNASDQGGAIYAVANTYKGTATPWTEIGLNWNNAPTIGGTPLASLGAVAVNTWVEFDVTAALSLNGTYNFGLQTASTNDVRYSSRDADTNQPQLIIQQSENPLPLITGFSPTAGIPGSEVTILGSYFTGITAVQFGGVAASFTVDSSTQIRAVVPAGATSGKLSLLVTGGSAASSEAFTLQTAPPPPTIASFSPASGPAGTEVTINGSSFVAISAVTFNNLPASSFTVDSATQIRAVVPASATSGKLRITSAFGSATSATSFTLAIAPPPPPPPPPVPTVSHWSIFLPITTGSATASSSARLQLSSWRSNAPTLAYFCELEGR